MRKIIIAIAALGAFAVAAPLSADAATKKVIIKHGGEMHRDHHNVKKVIIKRGHDHDRDRGHTTVIKHGGGDSY
jgi:Ni/Co efflux regulator RcnB